MAFSLRNHPVDAIDQVLVGFDDPQVGEWRVHNPSGRWPSFHLSQVLSPTITPHEILSAWHAADTVPRRQNV
jgi:hypothetical protein